tara:strand:- start:157 stop:468 length:312 start_codon:yes stop_codon:yes gene_type:complete
MAIETEIVANTPTTVITAPASTTYAIIGMFFTNHDSAVDETIDINVVKSGESVGNSNVIAKSVALTATNTLTYTEKFLIDDGDSIVATSANGTVNAVITYTTV